MLQDMRYISLGRQSKTVRTHLKPHVGGKSVTKSRVYEFNHAGGTSKVCNPLWVF